MPIRPDTRPTDYEHAFLSNDVYLDKKKNEIVTINIPGRSPQKWHVIAVERGALSYFGVIYRNYETNHLIVAHRGSNCIGSVIEDIQGVFLNANSPQKEAAYAFTQQAIEKARENRLSLSFTGHSLGAYLSELSLYICVNTANPTPDEFDVREGANAVVFESPGFLNTMAGLMFPNVAGAGVKEESLDITTYLSYPNLINSCNSHLGTVYTLMPDVGGWSQLPGFHLNNVHSMKNILTLFENSNEKRPQRLYMTDWPLGAQFREYFKTVTFQNGKYRWQDNGETQEGEENVLSSYVLKEKLSGYGLNVKGHFQVDAKLSNWFTVPLRHFPASTRAWLEAFYGAIGCCLKAKKTLSDKLKAKLSEKGINGDLLESLLGTLLTKHHYKGYVYVESLSGDGNKMCAFRRELTRWLSERGENAQADLLNIMHEIQNIPDIQATLMASGAKLLKGGVLNNPRVQAIDVYIPDDTNPQMLAYFQTASEQFFKNIKASDIKISAVGIEAGAEVEGVINNMSVTGAKFIVGKPVIANHPHRLLSALAGFGDSNEAAQTFPQAQAQAQAISDQWQRSNILGSVNIEAKEDKNNNNPVKKKHLSNSTEIIRSTGKLDGQDIAPYIGYINLLSSISVAGIAGQFSGNTHNLEVTALKLEHIYLPPLPELPPYKPVIKSSDDYIATQYEAELQQKLSVQKDDVKKIAICGIAGSGKTILAEHFLEKVQQDYPQYLTHTLLAETKEQWEFSLRLLAERLHERFHELLNTTQNPEKQKQHIHEAIKNACCTKPWAILLDNWDQTLGPHIGEIEDIFGNGHGTLLITTQDGSPWRNHQSLKLSEGFSPVESRKLLLKVMDLEKELEITSQELGDENELNELTKTLNHSPLTIVLAGKYLLRENRPKHERGQAYITFREYKNLIEKNKKASNAQMKTQEIVIDLTLQKAIRLSLDNPRICVWLLLCFCSFLGSNNIPQQLLKDYFQKFLNKTNIPLDERFEDALETAQRYSLIQFENHHSLVDHEFGLCIHRTVQQVIRNYYWPRLLEKIKAISSPLTLDSYTSVECMLSQPMNQALKHRFSQIIENEHVPSMRVYYIHSEYWMRYLPVRIGNKQLFVDDIALQSDIALASDLFGDHEKARRLFKNVLKFMNEQPKYAIPTVLARLQQNYATALQALGYYAEAEKLYRKALILFVEKYGKSHPETIIIQQNLAVTLWLLDRHEEANIMRHEGLTLENKEIQEKHQDLSFKNITNPSGEQSIGYAQILTKVGVFSAAVAAIGVGIYLYKNKN